MTKIPSSASAASGCMYFDELAGMAKKGCRECQKLSDTQGRQHPAELPVGAIETIPECVCLPRRQTRSEYLQDETGNRRFWPVPCDGAIDARLSPPTATSCGRGASALRWWSSLVPGRCAARSVRSGGPQTGASRTRGCPEFSNGHAIPTAWSLASTVARIRGVAVAAVTGRDHIRGSGAHYRRRRRIA